MNLSLIGKRAVVTGASLGIGAVVVKMLSEYGAEVEYSARNPTVVEDQLGQKIKGHAADMSDQGSTTFIENVLALGPPLIY